MPSAKHVGKFSLRRRAIVGHVLHTVGLLDFAILDVPRAAGSASYCLCYFYQQYIVAFAPPLVERQRCRQAYGIDGTVRPAILNTMHILKSKNLT